MVQTIVQYMSNYDVTDNGTLFFAYDIYDKQSSHRFKET